MARIEVATVKTNRQGHDDLLLGLRCEPELEGPKKDGLVWEEFELDDPRLVERAVHFAGRFGVECTPEVLTLEAIGPVLRALCNAPPRLLRVEQKPWWNGQVESWKVTGFYKGPMDGHAQGSAPTEAPPRSPPARGGAV